MARAFINKTIVIGGRNCGVIIHPYADQKVYVVLYAGFLTPRRLIPLIAPTPSATPTPGLASTAARQVGPSATTLQRTLRVRSGRTDSTGIG
ncbi:hypothetical protein AGABI1DRAFT_134607 [Agaricus bisporus var. burnettii JB137-S8]|uniref:Uncharacterized protein n=1 Tax=Agaricus bisporus var. burnettii (strain JB137-S8 / ATCC MYA-4627 / FGSC 10392) TaxID=597362 RepID=K5WE38_AGABU|nr:uncharacterized protein AGABI1DRAFT_134607 [Agaricus bisporus var. burnettii JB137-S8]EKM73521.1 hypothetical protein AGABI1DRAFT_134607 [Agaricus bisporus var. burnettii JB137-S8]